MLMDEKAGTGDLAQDFFKADGVSGSQVEPAAHSGESVSWTASEFLHHQKTSKWYLLAVVVLAVIGGLAFLAMREWIGPASIVVLGAILLVAASRKPRNIEYIIDEHGVVIGQKEYLYSDLLSFSIIHEDSMESIMIVPQKRWAMPIYMYFAPEDGQRIFDILSVYLPFEKREKDSLDKFLHKIRF